MKTCTKCGIEKENNEFYDKRQSKDGLSSFCKACFKKIKQEKMNNKEYYDTQRKKRKEWEINNKQHLKELCKKNHELKKEHYKKLREKWLINNPNYTKEYQRKNKDKINKRHHIRYDNEINYKIKCNLRNRFRVALKNNYKTGSAIRDLGCSINDFKLYMESKFYLNVETGEMMTWKNQHLWHIDHIRPLSSFDLTDPEQVKIACHYTNLQPLWAKENLSKGDKYEEKL